MRFKTINEIIFRIKLAMFSAHFTDNMVMDDDSVLAQIAESVGLDKKQALHALHSESYREKVDKEETY